MKIFINTTSWAIVKQENETPIIAGNNYVDQLKVYYDSDPSTQYFYPTLNILKPNDRKVGLISFDATSVEEPNPSTYTDDDNNTWYMFKFTLSSDNHQIDVSGKYQFTITTNYYNSTNGAILKQRNINTILSVVNAVTNDDNSVLILSSGDPSQVVAELYALCQSLQTGVASLQISVSALTSNKADRDNTSQTIKAGLIKTNTLQGNGFGVLVDDEVSFNDITWFTDGDGTNKWKIFYNSDGNLQFTSVTPAKKVEIANIKVNEIHDGTGTSEIEMTLGGIQFIAKKWDNPSLFRQINFYYESGLQVDEPTYNFNPTTKNYVDTKDALKLDKANVYNGLDKTADGFALDARQGKALKDALDTLYNYVGYATGNDDDTTINKLREIFQFLAGEADDATLLSLLAGKQAKIDSDNKLEADLVDDTNNTHKFVTAEEKQQIQTNADNIASHDTALNNRYTKTETDTLLATKQDVLTGSDSVDLTGNVVSVKDSYVESFFATDLEVQNMLSEVFD